ncbi:MAG TPA: DUF305 domain-containing protein [Jatrophihabitantaceae bacterium]
MADTLMAPPEEVDVSPPPRNSVRVALLASIGVLVLVIAVGGGFIWGSAGNSGSSALYVPGSNSVDGGFARDMATHHQQAITMATYANDNSTNGLVRNVAYDIESSQSIEMGEMEGWLLQWHISRNTNSPMKWMAGHHFDIGPNGLMPGMATPAQMTKLMSLHGHALDIMFLQLMIHHHQGGVQMALYAAQHAHFAYMRNLAQHMYNNQTAEIVQMEQLLRQLGGSPLPPPTD